MADIEAAPVPAAARKESAATGIVEWAAARPRELLALTADAVFLCFATAVSVNNVDLVASSSDCGLEGVSGVVVLALLVTLGLVLVLLFAAIAVMAGGLVLLNFAVLLSLLWSRCRRRSSDPDAGEIGWDGSAKRGRARSVHVLSALDRAGKRDDGGFIGVLLFKAVALGLLLLFKAVSLGLLLLLCAPANGYCGKRVCSMLTDIRCFPYSVNALLRRFLELVSTKH